MHKVVYINSYAARATGYCTRSPSQSLEHFFRSVFGGKGGLTYFYCRFIFNVGFCFSLGNKRCSVLKKNILKTTAAATWLRFVVDEHF